MKITDNLDGTRTIEGTAMELAEYARLVPQTVVLRSCPLQHFPIPQITVVPSVPWWPWQPNTGPVDPFPLSPYTWLSADGRS